MSETHETHLPVPGGGYEKTDATLRPIVVLAVILSVIVVVGLIAIGGLTVLVNGQLARTQPPVPSMFNPNQTPPEPRLQVLPRDSWQQMLAQDTKRLNSYGWVDQNGGVVHIPIDRAMELLLQRGLPVRQQEPGQAQPDLQDQFDPGNSGGQAPSRAPGAAEGSQ